MVNIDLVQSFIHSSTIEIQEQPLKICKSLLKVIINEFDLFESHALNYKFSKFWCQITQMMMTHP